MLASTPSMEFESEIIPPGNPDSSQKQHALDSSREVLPATYRSHGSLHELSVPIVVHNCPAAPEPSFYKNNLDLARWLYAT